MKSLMPARQSCVGSDPDFHNQQRRRNSAFNYIVGFKFCKAIKISDSIRLKKFWLFLFITERLKGKFRKLEKETN